MLIYNDYLLANMTKFKKMLITKETKETLLDLKLKLSYHLCDVIQYLKDNGSINKEIKNNLYGKIEVSNFCDIIKWRQE